VTTDTDASPELPLDQFDLDEEELARLELDLAAVAEVLEALDRIPPATGDAATDTAAEVRMLLDGRFLDRGPVSAAGETSDGETSTSDLVGGGGGSLVQGAGVLEEVESFAEQPVGATLDPTTPEVGDPVMPAPEVVLDSHDDPAVGDSHDLSVVTDESSDGVERTEGAGE
jgi:hypothetical protein